MSFTRETNKPEADGFYRAFEDRYRGSRELIRSRQSVYLPFIEPLLRLDPRASAVDLGCGRGEWLELLKDVGFDPQGVDLDDGMLEACHELGLKVTKADAIDFLKQLPDSSQMIVSGFHIVEHLPFPVLRALVEEALRVLKPGGLLILETPNPENIRVGSTTFHMDPTHQKPLPPRLLSFVAEYHGFARVKVVGLNEPPELRRASDATLSDVLGGASPDYAVVAQKSANESLMKATAAAFAANYGVTLDELLERFNHHMNIQAQAFEAERAERVAEIQRLEHQILTLEQETMAIGRFLSNIGLLYATKRSARWLLDGTSAWVAFKPGSRPHRLARTTLLRLANHMRAHPKLAFLSRQLVTHFPAVGNRLRALIHRQRAEKLRRFIAPPADEPADLSMEPHSVRLIYRRLMRARANLEYLQPAEGRHNSALPRLAYVSPLPPEKTGIADYSAELLPELVRYYDIDVVVAQEEVSDPWIKEHCRIRTVEWFERNAHSFDRIIYHIGNSLFHLHMLPLLEKYPGVVILHDFYQSGLLAHMELQCDWQGIWTNALYRAHGYRALRDRFVRKKMLGAIHDYPANLSVLENAQGIIVHSQYSKSLTRKYYDEHFADDWAVVPLPRQLPQNLDRKAHRETLGLSDDDFLVCSFGILGETKLNQRLLDAWLRTPLTHNKRCHLVFVGQDDQSQYCIKLRKTIDASPAKGRIRITGFAPPELYKTYLQAADVAVQLRAFSRGETSAAVLDCMAHAVPTVVNANGSMAEVPQNAVVMLPDEFTTSDLAHAIMSLWENPSRRHELSGNAKAVVRDQHSPSHIAGLYFDAIERFARSAQPFQDVHALAVEAQALMPAAPEDPKWLGRAEDISRQHPLKRAARQLLVDVSVLAQDDYKTGIQRVVRAQLLSLLNNPPAGFRVEPVRLSNADGQWHYRYASRYVSGLLGFPNDVLDDEPVEVSSGDIFYMPDYWTDGVVHATKAGIYRDWRARGVETTFMVYDMLPLLRPEFFPDFAPDTHAKWLSSLAESADRLICISHAVAEETKDWLNANKPEALQHIEVTALHLGADIDASAPTTGLPKNASTVLGALKSRPSYLMVGTIEPRKGYLQALAAFESLWQEGVDANLVIVGAEGWKAISPDQRRTIPQIIKKLRNHPELGKRLFWLEGISDEYLEKVYASCVCLIAASEGEGFGLPLIEAARHKIPILARDIPVFREVAGAYASYFSGTDAAALVQAIKDWQALHKENRAPKSQDMPWLTWAENVEALKVMLLPNQQTWGHTSEPHQA